MYHWKWLHIVHDKRSGTESTVRKWATNHAAYQELRSNACPCRATLLQAKFIIINRRGFCSPFLASPDNRPWWLRASLWGLQTLNMLVELARLSRPLEKSELLGISIHAISSQQTLKLFQTQWSGEMAKVGPLFLFLTFIFDFIGRFGLALDRCNWQSISRKEFADRSYHGGTPTLLSP